MVMFEVPEGVDEATEAIVAQELAENDRIPYIRGILADMHNDDPKLYELLFKLAAKELNNALHVLTVKAIEYRLICVQHLRDPECIH